MKTLRKAREEIDRAILRETLTVTGGNIVQTSSLLDVSRQSLYALLDKYAMWKFVERCRARGAVE